MTTTNSDNLSNQNGSAPSVAPTLSASASAPGKLILFGEHAVVHNQPAIAACLSDLRIQVDAQIQMDTDMDTDGIVSIQLPDLKPDPVFIEIPFKSLSLLKIPQNATENETCDKDLDFKSWLIQKGPPTMDDTKTIREILMKNISNTDDPNKNNSSNINENNITAITPLIYLMNVLILPTLLQLQQQNDKCSKYGFSIIAKSHNLPLGAGLGSSAAFSVATSAALYKLMLLLKNDENHNSSRCQVDQSDEEASSNIYIEKEQQPTKKMKIEHINQNSIQQPTKEQLEIINTLAFYSETLIHGNPSGIDNTVSTYGGALQYKKTKYSQDKHKPQKSQNESETIFLDNFPELNVILTNTNVPRSTKSLVHGVKVLKEEHPLIIDPVLDSIGNIARTFRKNIIEKNKVNKLSPSQQKQISKLIQMNHSLLCVLGVSHPSLNAIANMTANLYHQMKSSTKLTGAGGGGCAFTFLEDDDIDNSDNNGENNNGNCAKSTGSSIQERLKIVSEKIEALKNCETISHDKNDQASSWSFQCFKSAVGGKGVVWH